MNRHLTTNGQVTTYPKFGNRYSTRVRLQAVAQSLCVQLSRIKEYLVTQRLREKVSLVSQCIQDWRQSSEPSATFEGKK
jgi:hypothetical protein